MKTKMLSLIALVFITMTTVTAQTEKKETFKVAGSCGMCETRIENAAKSVDGVLTADWDKETKMIDVKFDSDKVNIHKVHMAIAKVGHDTKMHKASNDVYDKLPACCKYDRMEEEAEKK
jgi:mercuric ion binding protein